MSYSVDECTCTHRVFLTLKEAQDHFFEEHHDFGWWNEDGKTPRLQNLTNQPSLTCVSCRHVYLDLKELDDHVIASKHAPHIFNARVKLEYVTPKRKYNGKKRFDNSDKKLKQDKKMEAKDMTDV